MYQFYADFLDKEKTEEFIKNLLEMQPPPEKLCTVVSPANACYYYELINILNSPNFSVAKLDLYPVYILYLKSQNEAWSDTLFNFFTADEQPTKLIARSISIFYRSCPALLRAIQKKVDDILLAMNPSEYIDMFGCLIFFAMSVVNIKVLGVLPPDFFSLKTLHYILQAPSVIQNPSMIQSILGVRDPYPAASIVFEQEPIFSLVNNSIAKRRHFVDIVMPMAHTSLMTRDFGHVGLILDEFKDLKPYSFLLEFENIKLDTEFLFQIEEFYRTPNFICNFFERLQSDKYMFDLIDELCFKKIGFAELETETIPKILGPMLRMLQFQNIYEISSKEFLSITDEDLQTDSQFMVMYKALSCVIDGASGGGFDENELDNILSLVHEEYIEILCADIFSLLFLENHGNFLCPVEVAMKIATSLLEHSTDPQLKKCIQIGLERMRRGSFNANPTLNDCLISVQDAVTKALEMEKYDIAEIVAFGNEKQLAIAGRAHNIFLMSTGNESMIQKGALDTAFWTEYILSMHDSLTEINVDEIDDDVAEIIKKRRKFENEDSTLSPIGVSMVYKALSRAKNALNKHEVMNMSTEEFPLLTDFVDSTAKSSEDFVQQLIKTKNIRTHEELEKCCPGAFTRLLKEITPSKLNESIENVINSASPLILQAVSFDKKNNHEESVLKNYGIVSIEDIGKLTPVSKRLDFLDDFFRCAIPQRWVEYIVGAAVVDEDCSLLEELSDRFEETVSKKESEIRKFANPSSFFNIFPGKCTNGWLEAVRHGVSTLDPSVAVQELINGNHNIAYIVAHENNITDIYNKAMQKQLEQEENNNNAVIVKDLNKPEAVENNLSGIDRLIQLKKSPDMRKEYVQEVVSQIICKVHVSSTAEEMNAIKLLNTSLSVLDYFNVEDAEIKIIRDYVYEQPFIRFGESYDLTISSILSIAAQFDFVKTIDSLEKIGHSVTKEYLKLDIAAFGTGQFDPFPDHNFNKGQFEADDECLRLIQVAISRLRQPPSSDVTLYSNTIHVQLTPSYYKVSYVMDGHGGAVISNEQREALQRVVDSYCGRKERVEFLASVGKFAEAFKEAESDEEVIDSIIKISLEHQNWSLMWRHLGRSDIDLTALFKFMREKGLKLSLADAQLNSGDFESTILTLLEVAGEAGSWREMSGRLALLGKAIGREKAKRTSAHGGLFRVSNARLARIDTATRLQKSFADMCAKSGLRFNRRQDIIASEQNGQAMAILCAFTSEFSLALHIAEFCDCVDSFAAELSAKLEMSGSEAARAMLGAMCDRMDADGYAKLASLLVERLLPKTKSGAAFIIGNISGAELQVSLLAKHGFMKDALAIAKKSGTKRVYSILYECAVEMHDSSTARECAKLAKKIK